MIFHYTTMYTYFAHDHCLLIDDYQSTFILNSGACNMALPENSPGSKSMKNHVKTISEMLYRSHFLRLRHFPPGQWWMFSSGIFANFLALHLYIFIPVFHIFIKTMNFIEKIVTEGRFSYFFTILGLRSQQKCLQYARIPTKNKS